MLHNFKTWLPLETKTKLQVLPSASAFCCQPQFNKWKFQFESNDFCQFNQKGTLTIKFQFELMIFRNDSCPTILKPGGLLIFRCAPNQWGKFARNHKVVLIFITHSILLDFGNSIDKNMQWAARTLLVCLLMYWHSFCSCKLFYINWFLIPSPCAHDHISCMPNMLHPSKFAYYGQEMIL